MDDTLRSPAMGALLQVAQAHKDEPYQHPISSRKPFDCGKLVRASVNAGQWTPALVTIPNVELLETGEDWETSTGLFTWDEADLNSAVESQEDPGLRTAVIKLGHVDPRFDGQPAFGRIENMRVDNNGQTLLGDLVGVPSWLAQVMPTAYPRRSIEGYFDYNTRTGNKWPFVLTALALLGDAYPAISTLEDLQILWGEEAPPLVPVEEVEELVAASADSGYIRAMRRADMVSWLKTRRGEEVAASAPPNSVQAASSIDDVRRAFYDSLDGNQMWWWIRQVLVNPFQLVVDDDDGGLYLVDVTVDASDNITFGEPNPVKVEYVAATASGLAEVHKQGQIVCASFGDRVAAGAKGKEEEGAQGDLPNGTEEEQDVKLTDDALRALGLEPGATEEQINAAILAKSQGGDGGGDGTVTTEPGSGNEPSAPTTQPTTPATDPAAQPATAPAPDPAPATQPATDAAPVAPVMQLPPGTVLVDEAQWAQVQQGVAAALRTEAQQRETERENALNAAVMAGKFPPARVEHYRTLWNADPEGTKVMLSSMADGIIPVTERGNAGGADPQATQESAYPESWLRDPRVAAARSAVSTRVKVVND